MDLKSKVIVGLTSTVKRHPAVGWVRASEVPSGTRLMDILALKDRVSELEGQLERNRTEPPPGTEDLQRGEDLLPILCTFTARVPGDFLSSLKYKAKINSTWNDIFAGVAPAMINESANADLRRVFKSHLSQLATDEFKDNKDFQHKELRDFAFPDHQIDTFIVQFRALGLIQESDRRRSIKDTATYWALTPYGDRLMVQLRAVRRTPIEHKRAEGTAQPATSDDAA